MLTHPRLRGYRSPGRRSRPGLSFLRITDPADDADSSASPERLARALPLTDLPLLLFLARVILRLDIEPLLAAAYTGLGRETLVREMERMGRQRAAGLLRRLRAFIWSWLGGALLLALLIARFSR